MNRTAGFMALQLALLLVSRRSELVTKDLIAAFTSLWTSEPLRQFCTPPVLEEAADPHERAVNVAGSRRNVTKTFYIFHDILSIPGLRLMTTPNAFAAMESLLIELLVARLLTIDHVNQQCVRFLREDWPTVINRQ